MILKEELLSDIREFKAPVLAQRIIDDKLLNVLFLFTIDKDHLLSSRAMWVFGHCSDINYNLTKPFHLDLINNLKENNLHNGVIRNTLRLFQKHPVPQKTESFLLDKCFEYIKNPSEAIAVRAFAITIVFNISKPYPDLLNELLLVLTHMNETENSPGIKSRVKNTIKAIHKLKK